jgi:predicted dehydrogenase
MGRSGESRRDFLRQIAATSALLASSRGLALAEVAEEDETVGPPVALGVVGLGPWGREILSTLAQMGGARIAAVCDTYPAFLRKGAEIAPHARAVPDHRALLDMEDVEAVVVATPSHLHKDVALAALQAGKHVYCEAPLAATIDESGAIARGAAAAKTVFQGGLQGRSNALYRHVAQFVKTGVLGAPALVSVRFNRKDSWRRAAPTKEREAELNWRLSAATSPGLVGEAGIHGLDLAAVYLAERPTAVTGFGTTVAWNDGRDVPDTVDCVFEYARGVRVSFSGTLASSMGASYALFQGDNASLMMREKRAWMIKEADSPLLGWEVYARKEKVLDETGIAMIADATKILAAGQEPGQVGSAEPGRDPLHLAFEAFFRSIRKGEPVACGPREAYQATAVALTATQAVRSGSRIPISNELLELA